MMEAFSLGRTKIVTSIKDLNMSYSLKPNTHAFKSSMTMIAIILRKNSSVKAIKWFEGTYIHEESPISRVHIFIVDV